MRLRLWLENGAAFYFGLGQWYGLGKDAVRARFPGQHEARGADLAHCRPPGRRKLR